jgi:hypothetical protein
MDGGWIFNPSLRKSDCMVRIVALMLACCQLLGCSLLHDDEPSGTAKEPTAQDLKILQGKIRDTFPQLKLAGSPEISPVQLNKANGVLANWTICLRNDAPDGMRYYAFYVQGSEVKEYRLAVMMDGCERQTFAPIPKT